MKVKKVENIRLCRRRFERYFVLSSIGDTLRRLTSTVRMIFIYLFIILVFFFFTFSSSSSFLFLHCHEKKIHFFFCFTLYFILFFFWVSFGSFFSEANQANNSTRIKKMKIRLCVFLSLEIIITMNILNTCLVD